MEKQEMITRAAAVREFERLRRCGEETLRLETVIAILMHIVPSEEKKEAAPKRGGGTNGERAS